MMAHFAEIDSDNKVVRVLVVPDNAEDRGQDYLANDLGLGGTWIQTSYTNRIRKNFAGVGFDYDATRDAFIAPKPYASWLLNEDTCQWEAPVAYPTDGVMYKWNEDKTDWEATVNE
jgi:hypothetical protein